MVAVEQIGRKDAGLEPDECFIIGTERKPVPDLAIEVIARSGGICSVLEIAPIRAYRDALAARG